MLRIGCKPMMLITQTWLMTCLKIFKVSCCRLIYHLPLEVFACLEVWPLGHDGSDLLSVVTQALFCNSLCAGFLFPLFRWCWWWLSVGTSGLWELDSVVESVAGVELPNEVFTSRARWMPLIIEWNTSASMFFLLKHLLLLIFVIFKLKCNNFIFLEIMVLNASYVCLHAFLLRRESPNLDPGRLTPYFWGGSITNQEWGSLPPWHVRAPHRLWGPPTPTPGRYTTTIWHLRKLRGSWLWLWWPWPWWSFLW
jgi:hypothetical protein